MIQLDLLAVKTPIRHPSANVAALLCCTFFTWFLSQASAAAADEAPGKGGTLDERNELRRWVGKALPGEAAACPFSFTYDGTPSTKLLGQWQRTTRNLPPADGKEQCFTIWTDIPGRLLSADRDRPGRAALVRLAIRPPGPGPGLCHVLSPRGES